MLDADSYIGKTVTIIRPNRELQYFEEHILPFIGCVGEVVSERKYTCTVCVKTDTTNYIPLDKDCIKLTY
jgi:hypothetical protein